MSYVDAVDITARLLEELDPQAKDTQIVGARQEVEKGNLITTRQEM